MPTIDELFKAETKPAFTIDELFQEKENKSIGINELFSETNKQKVEPSFGLIGGLSNLYSKIDKVQQPKTPLEQAFGDLSVSDIIAGKKNLILFQQNKKLKIL